MLILSRREPVNICQRSLRIALIAGLCAGVPPVAWTTTATFTPLENACPYNVVARYPHDRGAFTQGLTVVGERVFESTGQYGQSSLREVELETGRLIQVFDLADTLFGEGATYFRGKIYQVTWRSQRGLIYSAYDLRRIGEFDYDGEGWGLTHDGELLILSDGTSRLRFLNPKTSKVVRRLEVTANSKPVAYLNELEFAHGHIWANVWQTSLILKIDPASGKVVQWVDLTPIARHFAEDGIPNGIAWHEQRGVFLITGKNWPYMFALELECI